MKRASSSGLANEAGSVHRRGVATFLAVYGLLSKPLPALHSSNYPVKLEFETDQPTDDINCVMSDGATLYISAKRTCGDDNHLKSTLEQWIEQVPRLAAYDCLVLAVAEPRGPVRHLSAALEKRRAGAAGYSSNEVKALEALNRHLDGAPTALQQRVLDAARVLEIDARQPGSPQFDLAAASLEGVLVAAGHGPRSVQVLSSLMHTTAGMASACDIDAWVLGLDEAGVEIFADGQGPAGAATQARRAAVEAYLERLRGRRGIVDLSLLAEDLPPLVVPDLADGLQVAPHAGDESETTSLLPLARRWPRMLLIGLPGMGKSTALRQLAATWADDDRAPLPILVPLGQVARSSESTAAITLDRLCEVAAENAPYDQRMPLAQAMVRACTQGHAVLLLDGLDECLDRRALVADGLKLVLNDAPSDLGVVLTTRSSGEPAARRLDLPAVTLVTPQNLKDVLRKLLRHIAETRILDDAARNQWVAPRSRWLDSTQEAHKDLAEVPLLATLLALIAADAGDVPTPRDRAHLLMGAVEQSVARWESKRTEPSPTRGQLLDGYAVLGHVLSVSQGVDVRSATECVSRMLVGRWHMSPGHAEETSRQILSFWDDTVGVFVALDNGLVVARSRVFSEIGAAMRSRYLAETDLAAWVLACLPEPVRHVSLVLAAQLEPRVMHQILAATDAPFQDERRHVALEASRSGVALTEAQAAVLLESLAKRAQTGGWSAVLDLASAKLPAELRQARTELLAACILESEERTIATAHQVLADAAADDRSLTAEEALAVRTMLDLPLPDKNPRMRQVTRRSWAMAEGSRLKKGHAEAAALAPARIEDLDQATAHRISEIAQRGSMGAYLEALHALEARGYTFPSTLIKNLAASLTELSSRLDLLERLDFLRVIAQLSDTQIDVTPAARWRLPELGHLCALIELGKTGVNALCAVEDDEEGLLHEWALAATSVAELDPDVVAAQARVALADAELDQPIGTILLLSIKPPAGPPAPVAERLGTREQAALVAALGAVSELVSQSALSLLWQTGGESVSQLVLANLPNFTPPERYWGALLACRTADDHVQAIRGMLSEADPAARAGAAKCLSIMQDPDEPVAALIAELRFDRDLTVRMAAGHDTDGEEPERRALTWSCQFCAGYNDSTEIDCQHCNRGVRPTPRS